ncbi:MAG TPA: DUF882 domain-containing protein [Polyangiaceae bacterium]|jgi:hypothetical protein
MKALPITVALTLVSVPAMAAHGHHHHAKARHVVHPPTAMHTTQIHIKDESAVHTKKIEKPKDKEKEKTHARATPRPCVHEPVEIARGLEVESFSLTRCDGSPLPQSIDEVSVLARPGNVTRPPNGAKLAGVRRVDPGLLERLQQVADHFHARGKEVAMHIISGYRPTSVGSYHASAQALDFRVDGVRNEELVAFCKTLPDTGCGYYPNSSFVHMDVRATGTGHVAWIDASGPGESPHYVASWPPPPEPEKGTFAEKLTKILPPLPMDQHPSDVAAEAADFATGMASLKR